MYTCVVKILEGKLSWVVEKMLVGVLVCFSDCFMLSNCVDWNNRKNVLPTKIFRCKVLAAICVRYFCTLISCCSKHLSYVGFIICGQRVISSHLLSVYLLSFCLLSFCLPHVLLTNNKSASFYRSVTLLTVRTHAFWVSGCLIHTWNNVFL